MIELKNVNKTYEIKKQGQITALHDIDLRVERGEIFGVIGRSGAGKSTLIRCVNLLERPTSGKVWVNNHDMLSLEEKKLRRVRHEIGMIFQHFNLLGTRTVYQNIAFPLELLKKSKTEIEKIVTPLLELTGLTERRHVYPSQLSGGQKQRVAIARALATRPSVLLCDEMTSSLDPETTASILKLVKSINEQMQLSIMLITHEMEVIKSIADRVAVLDHGRIIEQADVVTLFKHPQTDVAKTFTQSVFSSELPETIKSNLKSQWQPGVSTVLRVLFTGGYVTEPVIDTLIKQYKVQVNILLADLQFLHHDAIGMMVIAIQADQAELNRAIQFLNEKDLTTEVLGYVTGNGWSFN